MLRHAGEEVLVVRAEDHAAAASELARYAAENAGWPPKEVHPAPISGGVHAAIVFGGLLVLLFTFQEAHRFGLDWEALGRADAAQIRAGEWWRAVTALFLHADLPHLAGNVVFGAVLSVILSASVGVGAAWWSALLSGTLGNYANAWLQDASHRSLGASTAVFGLLGAQVAYEFARRSELRYRPWRRWVPVIMGFGLLAWLGMGGVNVGDPDSLDALQRVDVGAHALGFAAGAGLGLLLARVPRRALRLSDGRQALVAAGAVLGAALAWTVAIASR
ncbi:MAG: rhomboid family intramembrane serine protease [Planctomycetes bacterium]|nr:rhomboid family intramembrane serine protease [Planctomycetota bacterium]